jgi:hypothetical protein
MKEEEEKESPLDRAGAGWGGGAIVNPRMKKGGRRRGNEPQDEARSAYVRYLALGRWEEIRDIWRGDTGEDEQTALTDLGAFLERGPYAAIWQRQWVALVAPSLASRDPGTILKALEAAIAASLDEEEQERSRRGDRSAFDERDFLVFMEQSVGRIFQEAWGEIDKA